MRLTPQRKSRNAAKERLRAAAVAVIAQHGRFHGEAHYLRRFLRNEHSLCLSPKCLRQWMQELTDEGHFTRSKHPHGGQGYTWGLPEQRA